MLSIAIRKHISFNIADGHVTIFLNICLVNRFSRWINYKFLLGSFVEIVFFGCCRCYDAEQQLEDRERHPSNSRDTHMLHPVPILFILCVEQEQIVSKILVDWY